MCPIRTQSLRCHVGNPFVGVLAITLTADTVMVLGDDFIVSLHLGTPRFVVSEVGPLIWDLNSMTSSANLDNFLF